MSPSFVVTFTSPVKMPVMKSRMCTIICNTSPAPSEIWLKESVAEFQRPEVELKEIQPAGIFPPSMVTETFVSGAFPGLLIVALKVWLKERDVFAVIFAGDAFSCGSRITLTLM